MELCRYQVNQIAILSYSLYLLNPTDNIQRSLWKLYRLKRRAYKGEEEQWIEIPRYFISKSPSFFRPVRFIFVQKSHDTEHWLIFKSNPAKILQQNISFLVLFEGSTFTHTPTEIWIWHFHAKFFLILWLTALHDSRHYCLQTWSQPQSCGCCTYLVG